MTMTDAMALAAYFAASGASTMGIGWEMRTEAGQPVTPAYTPPGGGFEIPDWLGGLGDYVGRAPCCGSCAATGTRCSG